MANRYLVPLFTLRKLDDDEREQKEKKKGQEK